WLVAFLPLLLSLAGLLWIGEAFPLLWSDAAGRPRPKSPDPGRHRAPAHTRRGCRREQNADADLPFKIQGPGLPQPRSPARRAADGRLALSAYGIPPMSVVP